MAPNLTQGHHALFKFEIAPPLLDAVGRSSLNNHVDRVLLERAAEQSGTDVLLHHGNVGGTIEQRLEETEELLLLVWINRAVVIQDSEQD